MPPASRAVIYIVGLSHSGSTVLDMLLTTGGKAVGLGQVWTVLRETPERTAVRVCSCGKPAPDCPVWGPVVARLAADGAAIAPEDRYRLVLDSVAKNYGAELAVIDSSKHASYLPVLADKSVYVLGAVNAPKAIEYREGMKVMEAILESGGFTKFADQNDVLVRRKEGKEALTLEVKAKRLFKEGDLSQNLELKAGDYVMVKESFF